MQRHQDPNLIRVESVAQAREDSIALSTSQDQDKIYHKVDLDRDAMCDLWTVREALARTIIDCLTLGNEAEAAHWFDAFILLPGKLAEGLHAEKQSKRNREFRRRLSEFASTWSFCEFEPLPKTKDQANSNKDQFLLKRVEQLADAGEIGRAGRLIVNSGEIIEINDQVLQQLRSLHPRNPPEEEQTLKDVLSSTTSAPAIEVTAEAVIKAIRQISTITGVGPSGDSSKIWKHLLQDSTQRTISIITEMFNHLVQGKGIDQIWRRLTSTRMIALSKRQGGIRPIACGEISRRILMSAVILSTKQETIIAAAGANQFGVGRKAGLETCIHIAQILAQDERFIAMDLKNAFGMTLRSKMIQEVETRLPSWSYLVRRMYAHPTLHKARKFDGGTVEIEAVRGCDQGCPISPIIFSITIAPVLEKLEKMKKGRRTAAYLDDTFVKDNDDTAIDDLEAIGAEFGLVINRSKCKVLNPGYEETVLGAPLFPNETNKSSKPEAFRQGIKSLIKKGLQAQTALSITNISGNSLAAFECTHNNHDENWVKTEDAEWRTVYEDILDSSLDDASWRRAKLPMKLGGIAANSNRETRLLSRVASWTRSEPGIRSFFGKSIEALKDTGNESLAQLKIDTAEVRRLFPQAQFKDGCITETESTLRNWFWAEEFSRIMDQLDENGKAHLNSVTCKEAAAWILKTYNSTEKKLDSASFRTALKLRLRLQVMAEDKCNLISNDGDKCQVMSDAHGDHSLRCLSAGGAVFSHKVVVEELKNIAAEAGWLAQEEVPLQNFQKQSPAVMDLLLTNFNDVNMPKICIDVSISHPVSSSQRTSRTRGNTQDHFACERRCWEKRNKYGDPPDGFLFFPFCVETTGRTSVSAKLLLDLLCKDHSITPYQCQERICTRMLRSFHWRIVGKCSRGRKKIVSYRRKN